MGYLIETGCVSMESLHITGGKGLCGSVRIPGAKNSVLPILAASILCHGTVTLRNVPQLSDVAASLQILNSLGCAATMTGDTIQVLTGENLCSAVPPHLMSLMRSSVFYLAPVLARTGRVTISQPGGCRLGARPIDIHLAGLCAMGAQVVKTETDTIVTAPNGLHGTEFRLRFPSVGATETLLMAAAVAQGYTVLHGVAAEPEIVDLAHFLQGAGAKISGAGTSTISIEGQELLLGTQHNIGPDRIVAATVLCAVAGCGGEALLQQCDPNHLQSVIELLQKAGCVFSASGRGSMCISSDGHLLGVGTVLTGVYPAFPTDVAPLLAAALLRSSGESVLNDIIFENRFACAKGFAALGAKVRCDEQSLHLTGTPQLQGAALAAEDLRGGAALCIAAMMAQGNSVVTGVPYIARGYENIAGLFSALGAQITLCTQDDI